MKKLLIILIVAISSCSVSKEPGVITHTKTARIVKGNAKHFQMRHDAKMKREGGVVKN